MAKCNRKSQISLMCSAHASKTSRSFHTTLAPRHKQHQKLKGRDQAACLRVNRDTALCPYSASFLQILYYISQDIFRRLIWFLISIDTDFKDVLICFRDKCRKRNHADPSILDNIRGHPRHFSDASSPPARTISFSRPESAAVAETVLPPARIATLPSPLIAALMSENSSRSPDAIAS